MLTPTGIATILALSLTAVVATVGYGPDKPIADNSTESRVAENEGIEFFLIRDKCPCDVTACQALPKCQ